MNKSKLLFMAALLMLFITTSCVGRPIQMWSPDELWSKADLVIIGSAERTHDAFPEENRNARPDDKVPVITHFTVEAVLKGVLPEPGPAGRRTVAVWHYRYQSSMAEVNVVDRAFLVSFNPKAKTRYLIFLKMKADGEAEPLSGQFDPWQSFLRLTGYGREAEGQEPPGAK